MAKLKTLKEYHRKVRENPEHSEAVMQVTTATGAYASTRVAGKIAYALGARKTPLLGKIAYVGSNVAILLAVYYLLRRVEKLEKYHGAALIGVAIANLQAIIQSLAPKYYWLLSDPNMGKKFPMATPRLIAPSPSTEEFDEEIIEEIPSPQSAGDAGDALESYDMDEYEDDNYAGSLAAH